MSGELVLVTGGSGSVGTRCILALLATGYQVRATVRPLRREADVPAMLAQGDFIAAEHATDVLSFTEPPLGDAGRQPAAATCCTWRYQFTVEASKRGSGRVRQIESLFKKRQAKPSSVYDNGQFASKGATNVSA